MLRRLPLQNPTSRFAREELTYDEGEVPLQGMELLEDQSRSILSENDSPDLPFRYSLNAYRGCAHGCSYCYARPSHEYLGLGAGTDFERKLLYKPRAPELLREAFERHSWKGEFIVISGNTDAYQPVEAELGLTRKCLEVCLEYRNPVGVITKSTLIERDVDLLAELHRVAHIAVAVSVTSMNAEVSRKIEPYAPAPQRRIETIRRLSARGIPVMVFFSPWIPGLTDQDLVPVLEAAREAGAISAMTQAVRLPGAVQQVFAERLERDFPDRAERVLGLIRGMRGGALNDSRFESRMKGDGAYAAAVQQMFLATKKRLGYGAFPAPRGDTFQRPEKPKKQLTLFS
jgi:DNA repair photolyase